MENQAGESQAEINLPKSAQNVLKLIRHIIIYFNNQSFYLNIVNWLFDKCNEMPSQIYVLINGRIFLEFVPRWGNVYLLWPLGEKILLQ